MIYKVVGESPFQVDSSSFSVSPSESGYDLYLSADGISYSKFSTVASGTSKQFTQMNAGNYYILSGNTSTVSVNWERTCGGGGGGTAGVSSLDGQTGALTLKTVNNNTLLGEGNIEIEGGAEVNYQIVNDLSAVTDAQEGTKVYVKSHYVTFSGYTIAFEIPEGDNQYLLHIKFSVVGEEGVEEELFLVRNSMIYWNAAQDIQRGQWYDGNVCNYYWDENINNNFILYVRAYDGYAFLETDTDEEQYTVTTSSTIEKQFFVDGDNFIYIDSATTSPETYILNDLSGSQAAEMLRNFDNDSNFFYKHKFCIRSFDSICKVIQYVVESNTYYYFFARDTKNRRWKQAMCYFTSQDYAVVEIGESYDAVSSYSFILRIDDLTGGTPYTYDFNGDNIKNLKDHANSQALTIALYHEPAGEDKQYATCTSWRFNGENNANEFYFYFDDVEFGGSRYRAVYKYDVNQDSWTVLYWDTFANYISSF